MYSFLQEISARYHACHSHLPQKSQQMRAGDVPGVDCLPTIAQSSGFNLLNYINCRCWSPLGIPILRRWKQGYQKSRVILSYTVNLWPAWAINVCNTVLKEKCHQICFKQQKHKVFCECSSCFRPKCDIRSN